MFKIDIALPSNVYLYRNFRWNNEHLLAIKYSVHVLHFVILKREKTNLRF